MLVWVGLRIEPPTVFCLGGNVVVQFQSVHMNWFYFQNTKTLKTRALESSTVVLQAIIQLSGEKLKCTPKYSK